MKTKSKILYFFLAMLITVVSSCVKDPYDGVVSNERSIEAISLGGGLSQVGPAIVDREAGHVTVSVLSDANSNFSSVVANVQPSYKANTQPASGQAVDFASNGFKYTYTVVAESGKTRDWVVEIVPFTEQITGTYKITGQVVYGGTGPEYGGGAVMNLTDKPWVWPATGGPEAELDNTLTFEFEGVTPDGKTYGTVTNSGGADATWADYQFILNPATDVNHFYRKIPKGEATWERDYAKQTITFKFADGTTATGSFIGPQTIDLGNGLKKTITNNAFDFALDGADDWGNIYSDYDKFVKRPRRFWIEVQKQ
jgi:hypothetical protein